jgi:cell division protein FtsW (lipid II flippase)
MFSDDNSIDTLKQLFLEIKKYGECQLEYAQLNLVEKLTKIIVMLILIFVCTTLGMMALFYLTFSFAYFISDYTGGLAGGFAVVALLVVVLAAIVFVMRKKLIIRPLVNFLANVLLSKTEK